MSKVASLRRIDDNQGMSNDAVPPILAVAPMMDWTDRHCRYFLRVLSPRGHLYTEMVTALALVDAELQRKASSACSNANGSIGANTGIVLKREPISLTTSSGSTILENDEGWKCLKRRIYS